MQKTAIELGIWAYPEQRKEFVALMNKQGFVRNYEMVLRTKQGVEKDMLYSCEAIECLGQSCLLTVGQDITERLEIDRMKHEFISITSHELRTPLTSLKGALDFKFEPGAGTTFFFDLPKADRQPTS